ESSGTTDARMAKFTEGVKEFKAQVKKCLTLPAGVAANQRIRTVIRVSLKRDGTLALDPEPIEYGASQFGPAMMNGALRAIRACAPYTGLPTEKYQDWKVLDIDFSPDQMMGS